MDSSDNACSFLVKYLNIILKFPFFSKKNYKICKCQNKNVPLQKKSIHMQKKIVCILVWLRRHTNNDKLGRYLEKKIAKLDGTFHYSRIVRTLYKELHGLSIGYGTYGGCWNNASMWWNNIVIGNYCSFAGHVTCFPSNHPMGMFTTHPIMYDSYSGGAEKQRYFPEMGQPSLTIGHDVWFGNNSVVLAGCKTIGNGAVIGAGSVVTKDVPPYAIVVGNPAKILRYRLTPDQIKRVEASKWWLLNKEELNEQMEDLLKLTQYS